MKRLSYAGAMLIAAASLAACGSSSNSTPTNPPSTAASEYAASQSTFMSNCIPSAQRNGLSQEDASAYCGCAFRGLQSTVPYQDYIAWSSSTTSSAPNPPQIQSIIDACNANRSAY